MIREVALKVIDRSLTIAKAGTFKDSLKFTIDVSFAKMIAEIIDFQLEQRNQPPVEFEQMEMDFEPVSVVDEDDISIRHNEKGRDDLENFVEKVEYRIPDRGVSLAHSQHGAVMVTEAEDKADNWDWEIELQNRSPERPYIIHQDEYTENQFDFSQQTVIFYAEDGILTSEDDVPIHNYQGLLGDLVFGHGSNDDNIVYIRNEKHHVEYEVLYDQGNYEKTILNMEWDDDTYYDTKKPPLKFKQSEE